MPSANECDRSPDLIVVGGGLAGLLTAAIVAGTGRKVVVLERSGRAGGRAITLVERGVHFNLGPHALYCRGPAFRLLRELGVSFNGGFPDARRGVLTDESRSFAIPRGIGSVLASRLLTTREKAAFLRLFAAIPRLDSRAFDRVSLEEWVGTTAGSGNLARLIRTLCRVGTYVDDASRLSAGAAIDQLKLVIRGGVWYLDGGWQVLVDGLRDRLRERGVDLRTGCRVESVRGGADGVTVELASGEAIRGGTAVLAIDPDGAANLLPRSERSSLTIWKSACTPVRAASLDVALSRLPRPHHHLAFGMDRPLYYSVHSASAELATAGVAVLHVMKYLGGDSNDPPQGVERELEAFLERLQPGWSAHVIARQFLPGLIVTHSLPRAVDGGLAGRPGATVEGCPNVFLAGDWVGPEGMLADASAASAREAARRVVSSLSATTMTTHARGGVSHATA
jgi:phytoene dehydrogenase-like protein